MQDGFAIPAEVDPCGGFVGQQYQIPEFFVPNAPPGPVWFFYFKPSGVHVMRSTGKEIVLLTTRPLVSEEGELLFDIDTGEVLYELR